MSPGEYVAVEKVESSYKTSPLVEQVWVYGNSFESCLVAVVVPSDKNIMEWAKSQPALVGSSYSQVCSSKAAAELLLKELTAVGGAAKLKGFEAVKAVHLDSTQFSVDNDLMTPTFKLRRAPLLKHYKKDIEALYEELRASGKVAGAAII